MKDFHEAAAGSWGLSLIGMPIAVMMAAYLAGAPFDQAAAWGGLTLGVLTALPGLVWAVGELLKRGY